MRQHNVRFPMVFLLVLAFAGLGGCGGNGGRQARENSGMGTLSLAVHWPEASGDAAKVIPSETERIRVTVTASDISSPITGEITKAQVVNGVGRIDLDVPSGTNRLVEAVAFDAAGTSLVPT